MTPAETAAEVDAYIRLREEAAADRRASLEIIDAHLARLTFLFLRAHFKCKPADSAENYRFLKSRRARGNGRSTVLSGKSLRIHRELVRAAALLNKNKNKYPTP